MSRVYPILEANTRPVKGQIYTLIEHFTGVKVVNDPYTVTRQVDESTGVTELVEKKTGKGKFLIRGVFQRSDVKNENKRVYPRAIWEKHCKTDAGLMRRVKQRGCIGEIEHPSNGAGSLKEAAILTTNLVLQSDGTVIGEAEVLDTPCGRILRDLYREEVLFGVSSRGQGSVGDDGVVDEDTFVPITWDAVGNPSTPGAYPKVIEDTTVSESARGGGPGRAVRVKSTVKNGVMQWHAIDESTNTTIGCIAEMAIRHGEKSMNPKTVLNSVKATVAALGTVDVSEQSASALNKRKTALEEALTQLDAIVEADASLKTLAEATKAKVTAMLSITESAIETEDDALDESIDEGKKAADEDDEDDSEDDEDDSEDDDEDEGDEEDSEDDDEDDDEDEKPKGKKSKNESRKPRTLGEAKKLLAEALTTIESLIAENDASNASIEEMSVVLEATETELTETANLLAAQTTIISELTQAEGSASALAEAVDAAIAENESLAEHRAVLMRSESVDEAVSLIAKLGGSAKAAKAAVTESSGRFPNLNERYDSEKQVKAVAESAAVAPVEDKTLSESANKMRGLMHSMNEKVAV